MAAISSTDYIRWVKGSLNRLLAARLPDNATINPDYRAWVAQLQINQLLPPTAKVDEATQNAIIKLNRLDPAYVRWVQIALSLSGEGIGPFGKGIRTDGFWDAGTEDAVKTFQINHEGTLVSDGWVGAKTETMLMARTGTAPPGRIRPRKPPPPGAWDDIATIEDRAGLMAKKYKALLAPAVIAGRGHQLFCFVGKLAAPSDDAHFRFLSAVDVNHCAKGRFGEVRGETLRQYVERFARSNARREILAALRKVPKGATEAVWFEAYQKAVAKSFARVRDGLEAIQRTYAWSIREAHDLRAGAMHNWALACQRTPSHIYSCFKRFR
ncbi:MAG: hypothetical protein HXY18_11925 [Bryobacteraceae bacterium]|nr:hypothetical protein [Bryobacteraceae bacterium]